MLGPKMREQRSFFSDGVSVSRCPTLRSATHGCEFAVMYTDPAIPSLTVGDGIVIGADTFVAEPEKIKPTKKK